MAGTAVMQQSSMPLRRVNQTKATGDKEASEAVVPVDAVTKDVAEEADASTTQNTNHQSEISRDNWRILEQF